MANKQGLLDSLKKNLDAEKLAGTNRDGLLDKLNKAVANNNLNPTQKKALDDATKYVKDSLTGDIKKLNEANTGIGEKVTGIIKSNAEYKTATDMALSKKLDSSGFDAAFKSALTNQNFAEAVNQKINDKYPEILEKAGKLNAPIQEKVDWLNNNIGTKPMVDFAKTIAANPNYLKEWNEAIQFAKNNKTNADAIAKVLKNTLTLIQTYKR